MMIDCANGVDGAPNPPCIMRQKTMLSRLVDSPHIKVEIVKPNTE